MNSPSFTILAEGAFGVETAKTASSAIRYAGDRVRSVIDARFAGQSVAETIGFGGDIPVVATLDAALAIDPRPDALLIGIANQGGVLPDAWRPTLTQALEAGLDLWSGLHTFLCDDPEISACARTHGRALRDLRKPPGDLKVGTGRARSTDAMRLLTVGTDCNTGKMTTALEVMRSLEDRGLSTGFGASGQTGILLAGTGIAVDAVVSDFVSGAAERLTIEAARGKDIVLIEGQGSLMHPAYSGVTLGLLHGSVPHAMILTWMPSRPTIYGGNHEWVDLPDLDEVVRRYEDALSWVCPGVEGKVIGVSLATWDISERKARDAVAHAESLTGLPATDPIRFGVEPLTDAVQRRYESLRGAATAS